MIRAIMAVCLVGFYLSPSRAEAQAAKKDLAGIWQGALAVSAIKLRVVFEVAKKGDAYSSVMKSLDQGGQAIPCSAATLTNGAAHLEVAVIKGAFDGTMSADGDTLTGTWTQGPGKLPLVLTRTDKLPEVRRPQEPKAPFPYTAEDVTYPSLQAGVTIAGTLTLPKGEGPFPVALLITGSGAQDRNEEILGHKPFLVIADYLTRRGIAVLRVDDRGVGKSTGNFATAMSADFAQDVRGGVAYLKTRKEINAAKIGLIGHSEGGLIAPMVAADSKDVAFIVLLAGPGVPGDQILPEQSALISKASGATDADIASNREMMAKAFAIVESEPDDAKAKEKLTVALKEAVAKLPEKERKQIQEQEGQMQAQIAAFTSPWFRYFLTYDPRVSLRKVSCPVLALNGENDLQVPPKQNLPAVEKALKEGGNTKGTFTQLAGLNHLFQTSKTGSPSDYNTIEETFAPIALGTMGDWIISTTK